LDSDSDNLNTDLTLTLKISKKIEQSNDEGYNKNKENEKESNYMSTCNSTNSFNKNLINNNSNCFFCCRNKDTINPLINSYIKANEKEKGTHLNKYN
jgi:hypothetical protein